MAKARRNLKTHPKEQGEESDGFTPPDTGRDVDDSAGSEVVDVFGKDTTITLDTSNVDQNSADEGDARNARSEEDDGPSDGGARPARSVQPPARNGRSNDRGNDEDADFSRRTRQRIQRERAVANRERTLREQTQAQLAEERTARIAQDERLARIERAQSDIAGNADVKSLETQIQTLLPQITAATEAGETAKALTLTVKLGELQGDLKLLKYDLKKKQEHAEAERARAATTRAAAPVVAENAGHPDPAARESAERFKTANRHWWNRNANQAIREDTVTIDAEVLADIDSGELDFDRYSAEHWDEVAKRLHKTYPDLEIQDLEGVAYEFDDEGNDMDRDDRNDDRRNGANGRQSGNRRQTNQRSTAPVSRMGNSGRRAPSELQLAQQGKVTLTDQDRAEMRVFKMDPNNATDKKYFAKEKLRSILNGTRSAQGDRR